jgi:iron(III) transport system substrate-binding protein
VPRYDTEANKSVAFYEEIVAEKDHPRCDVFWNNEILSTIRLQRQGLLAAHASPAAAPYPRSAKAKDHTWHAFAARARVLIVNNKLVPPDRRPGSLLGLTDVFWKGKLVMAKPQFGTTATQIACLFEVLGDAAAKTYLRGLKDNGLQLAPGNKQVAEWVARGATPTGHPVAAGLTDTDDALAELRAGQEAGQEVSLIFPDRGGGPGRLGTLFIPNTLCIPNGAPNAETARRLVDYLLSPEVEKSLAEGPSAQVPLNPKVTAQLPPQIATPAKVKPMGVDWARAADMWDQAQTFVNTLFGA